MKTLVLIGLLGVILSGCTDEDWCPSPNYYEKTGNEHSYIIMQCSFYGKYGCQAWYPVTYTDYEMVCYDESGNEIKREYR
jgi:hypothetical protein